MFPNQMTSAATPFIEHMSMRSEYPVNMNLAYNPGKVIKTFFLIERRPQSI